MDVLSIVLGAGTLIGGGGSIFLWFETRTQRSRDRRTEEIDVRLDHAMSPVQSALQEIHAKMDTERLRTASMIQSSLTEALGPVKDQLSALNVKVDPLWKALEALAVSNAQMIHKPHPANTEIDELLDAFVSYVQNGAEFTDSQERRLREFLTIIKNWKPGQDPGFHVEVGDPTRAAIVLSTMDLTRIRRKQEEQQETRDDERRRQWRKR